MEAGALSLHPQLHVTAFANAQVRRCRWLTVQVIRASDRRQHTERGVVRAIHPVSLPDYNRGVVRLGRRLHLELHGNSIPLRLFIQGSHRIDDGLAASSTASLGRRLVRLVCREIRLCLKSQANATLASPEKVFSCDSTSSTYLHGGSPISKVLAIVWLIV